MRKKILTFFIAFALGITALPVNAFATESVAEVQDTVVVGNYTGSYTKESAMAGTVVYTYSLNVKEDGSYTYEVSFPMGGETYTNTETGTYETEANVITFTPSADTKFKNDAETYTGTLENGVVKNITKCVSNFASSTTELTLAYEQVEDDKDTTDDNDIAFGTLESGKYAVDLTWVPTMDAMMDPIVEINATAKTFKVYNVTASETLKGNGTVKFDALSNVYTLVYEVEEGAEAKSTTFTYDAEKDTVTFTSKLWYGKASFDNTDENGNFVTYTAVVVKEDNTNSGYNNQDASNENSNENNNQDASDENSNENNIQNASHKESADTGESGFGSVWAMMTIAAFGTAMILVQKRKHA